MKWNTERVASMNLFIVFLFSLTLIACADRVLRCEPATTSSGRLPANCAASFLWVRQLTHIAPRVIGAC